MSISGTPCLTNKQTKGPKLKFDFVWLDKKKHIQLTVISSTKAAKCEGSILLADSDKEAIAASFDSSFTEGYVPITICG